MVAISHYLIGTSIVVTTTLLQGNTASAIVVMTVVTGAALSTSGGAVNDISETRAWRVAGFSADLVVAV